MVALSILGSVVLRHHESVPLVPLAFASVLSLLDSKLAPTFHALLDNQKCTPKHLPLRLFYTSCPSNEWFILCKGSTKHM